MSDVTDTFYASKATIGYGAQLEVGDGASPEAFEAVADVISIQFGAMTTAVVDKTHLRSLAAHREKIAAIRDSGAFAIKCIYDPTHESQSKAGGGAGAFVSGGLLEMWINRVNKDFRIKLNNGSPATVLPFKGVITKYQPGQIVVDNKIELDIDITPVQDFSSALP